MCHRVECECPTCLPDKPRRQIFNAEDFVCAWPPPSPPDALPPGCAIGCVITGIARTAGGVRITLGGDRYLDVVANTKTLAILGDVNVNLVRTETGSRPVRF